MVGQHIEVERKRKLVCVMFALGYSMWGKGTINAGSVTRRSLLCCLCSIAVLCGCGVQSPAMKLVPNSQYIDFCMIFYYFWLQLQFGMHSRIHFSFAES